MITTQVKLIRNQQVDGSIPPAGSREIQGLAKKVPSPFSVFSEGFLRSGRKSSILLSGLFFLGASVDDIRRGEIMIS